MGLHQAPGPNARQGDATRAEHAALDGRRNECRRAVPLGRGRRTDRGKTHDGPRRGHVADGAAGDVNATSLGLACHSGREELVCRRNRVGAVRVDGDAENSPGENRDYVVIETCAVDAAGGEECFCLRGAHVLF